MYAYFAVKGNKLMGKNEIVNINLQKNKKYISKIVDYGSNGEGIAKINGVTVFVPYTIVGEEVEILIILVKPTFAVGKAVNILTKSDKRVDAPCLYYKKCGGCQLQHIDYSEQLEIKKGFVKNCLIKYAGITGEINNVVPSEKQYRYRNKFAFPVGKVDGQIVVGMYRQLSHDLIAVDDCLLQEDCRDIIDLFKEWANEVNAPIYVVDGVGIRHIVGRIVNGEILFTIVSNSKLNNLDLFVKKLEKLTKKINLVNNINEKDNNVILGSKDIIVSGNNYIMCDEFDLKYPISVQSFMQINSYIKKQMYLKVLNQIKSTDVVIDAYSGAGVLSSIIAQKCKHVYAIEIVQAASDNAEELKKNNNINNLTNICGDCAKELPKLVNKVNSSIVVLDPPRKGCDKAVVDALCECLPNKIIYISCNPATLARDLSNLKAKYKIVNITPYDMFPQTANVETLVELQRQ